MLKFMPLKCQGLGLIPTQQPHTNQAWKCCVCNPTNGEAKTGRIKNLSSKPVQKNGGTLGLIVTRNGIEND